MPLTSHILLVGSMLLFFLIATLVTLQTSWQWWLIPVVVAIPVVIVLTQRYNKMQKAREARRLMDVELRTARPGRGSTDQPGFER